MRASPTLRPFAMLTVSRQSPFAARSLMTLAALTFAPATQGAGGHHAVDDAALLEPDQCQVEVWSDRRRGTGHLLHAGPACRVGAVELGVAADREQGSAGGVSTTVQAKWAAALDDQFAAGAIVAVGWQRSLRHPTATTLVLPFTWSREDWAVHVNAGLDWPREGRRSKRWGVAVEHAFDARMAATVERYEESSVQFARVALRWTPDPSLSFDLGRAGSVQGERQRWTTIGLTWVFSP